MTYDTIIQAIEARRTERGMSPSALCAAAGYTRPVYDALLHGRRPNARALVDFAEAAGVPLVPARREPTTQQDAA